MQTLLPQQLSEVLVQPGWHRTIVTCDIGALTCGSQLVAVFDIALYACVWCLGLHQRGNGRSTLKLSSLC
jgi:hypothetical protein